MAFFKSACIFEASLLPMAMLLGWIAGIDPFVYLNFSEAALFYLISKMLQQARHTGMDCRYPDYKDAMFSSLSCRLGFGTRKSAERIPAGTTNILH